ncbi:hypothetical protein SAY86_012203 [Trapa natans]|uniref:Uncharacterized protein n=1 Tax=Trapa natans TaxID=22666 RepID=A0AAN7R6T9_TRANT|nr:hypothetical protein SAY86_012203 [Trapa natans]
MAFISSIFACFSEEATSEGGRKNVEGGRENVCNGDFCTLADAKSARSSGGRRKKERSSSKARLISFSRRKSQSIDP